MKDLFIEYYKNGNQFCYCILEKTDSYRIDNKIEAKLMLLEIKK